jgi:hypothetical protein
MTTRPESDQATLAEAEKRSAAFRTRTQEAVFGYYERQRELAEKEARPKKKRAPGKYPSEREEQRVVVDWCRAMRLRYFVNLEGKYYGKDGAIRGAMAKAAGVVRGRPDIEITTRCPLLPEARGVFIEMKSRDPRARASPEQLAMADALREDGLVGVIAHGSDEAIGFLVGTCGYGA